MYTAPLKPSMRFSLNLSKTSIKLTYLPTRAKHLATTSFSSSPASKTLLLTMTKNLPLGNKNCSPVSFASKSWNISTTKSYKSSTSTSATPFPPAYNKTTTLKHSRLKTSVPKFKFCHTRWSITSFHTNNLTSFKTTLCKLSTSGPTIVTISMTKTGSSFSSPSSFSSTSLSPTSNLWLMLLWVINSMLNGSLNC